MLSGHPIGTLRTLADLVTVEAFEALLRHLIERQDGKSTEALHGLAGGLLAVARHHVGIDEETEARLATIVRNLDVGVTGFRSKTRSRLAAFEDDRSRVGPFASSRASFCRSQGCQIAATPQATCRDRDRDRDPDLCSDAGRQSRVTPAGCELAAGRTRPRRRWLISIPAGRSRIAPN